MVVVTHELVHQLLAGGRVIHASVPPYGFHSPGLYLTVTSQPLPGLPSSALGCALGCCD